MESTQLKGHGLQGEGAAYGHPDHYSAIGWSRLYSNTTSGQGHGLCYCGASSPWLFSGKQRREWHNAHKAKVRRDMERDGQ